MQPVFDKEKETMLDDVHLEVFGSTRNPERGLVKRLEVVTADLEPIKRFFQSAKWPVRIVIGALGLVLTSWLVDAIKMLPVALGLSK